MLAGELHVPQANAVCRSGGASQEVPSCGERRRGREQQGQLGCDGEETTAVRSPATGCGSATSVLPSADEGQGKTPDQLDPPRRDHDCRSAATPRNARATGTVLQAMLGIGRLGGRRSYPYLCDGRTSPEIKTADRQSAVCVHVCVLCVPCLTPHLCTCVSWSVGCVCMCTHCVVC